MVSAASFVGCVCVGLRYFFNDACTSINHVDFKRLINQRKEEERGNLILAIIYQACASLSPHSTPGS